MVYEELVASMHMHNESMHNIMDVRVTLLYTCTSKYNSSSYLMYLV